MLRPGGRGQWFVLAMFTRAKMRQSEQYVGNGELATYFYQITVGELSKGNGT